MKQQICQLSKDILAESLSAAKDMPELRDATRALEKCVADLRLAMDKPGLREPWYKIRNKAAIKQEIANLQSIFDDLIKQLTVAA